MSGPVALVTCARPPAPVREEVLEAAFDDLGVPWVRAVWDDPSVDWSGFRAVLVRTPWDYVGAVDRFVAWARRVEAVTTLWNPAAVIAWNANKRYLLDLAAAGVDIVPTVVLGPGDDPAEAEARAAAHRWDRVVVKPAVGSGSRGAGVFDRDDPRLAGAVARLGASGHELLIQPFLREIGTAGERSTILVDGTAGHAVRKRPAAGDYRTQEQFGAALAAEEPDPACVALGVAALGAATAGAGGRPGFARVDTVEVDGRPLLMELELIEPDLYLFVDPAAGGSTARRLAALVTAGSEAR